MPALLIKDFPPALHGKLRETAARHHRSMSRQALALLEDALRALAAPPGLPPPLRGRFPVTRKFVDRAKRAGRR